MEFSGVCVHIEDLSNGDNEINVKIDEFTYKMQLWMLGTMVMPLGDNCQHFAVSLPQKWSKSKLYAT